MALDYAALFDRLTNAETRKRLFVACRLKAFEIDTELESIPKHSQRLEWMHKVLNESIAINSKFMDEVIDTAINIQTFYQDVLTDADYLSIADKIANRMRA